jgi:hypothetical protein
MYKSCDVWLHIWYGCLLREEQDTCNLIYDSNTCIYKWLTKNVEGYGHKLYMDDYFSLPDVLNNLTKKKTSFCSAFRPNRKECHTFLLTSCFLLVSDLTYPLTLKMEAVWSSKTSVDFYQTILRYNPFIGSACHLLPPKCQWTSTRLHGITYQKVVLFIGCVCCLLFPWLTLRPQKWRQCVPPKCQWISTTLHGVTSQKTVLFTLQKMPPFKIYFACFQRGTTE